MADEREKYWDQVQDDLAAVRHTLDKAERAATAGYMRHPAIPPLVQTVRILARLVAEAHGFDEFGNLLVVHADRQEDAGGEGYPLARIAELEAALDAIIEHVGYKDCPLALDDEVPDAMWEWCEMQRGPWDGPGEEHCKRDRDRTELLIPEGKRFVPGDVQDLPFEDNSFSFVFCLHLLEHVDDTVRACQELQRVAPRGLIETPHAVLESCYDTPSHRWLVDLIDGVLVFVRKPERGAWRKIPHTHFPLHLFPQVVGFEFGYMRALWERPFLVEVMDAW